MGMCNSVDAGEHAEASKDIDKQLMKQRERLARELKLLLLGTGASGKSTIAKQMKVIHLDGYSDTERELFTEFIYLNVLQGMKTLVKAMDALMLQAQASNQDIVDYMRSITLQFDTIELEQTVGLALFELWKDPALRKAWDRRQEFALDESVDYFLDDLPRVSKPGYLPSLQDVLHVRIKTTGLKEIQFAYEGFTFRIVDVGGQRSERRKWIHCFQDVTAILYVVALSDYNLLLEEDMKTNRMVESLELFKKVVNNRWFDKVNVILFLNKKDLFEEKLKRVPITECFTDFEGDPNDYDQCVELISTAFRESNVESKTRKIYTHVTCATDTTSIEKVWLAVNEIVTSAALKEAHLE